MQKNNNTFMIVLLSATVVIVGVLVWLGYSKNAAITEELMTQRESVTNKIKNLSRKPYVNQSINQANEKRVEMLNENFNQVLKLNYDFNSRNFSVPMLDVIGSAPRPALPYDAKVWENKELAAKYVGSYRKTMGELLAKLKPTSTPTEAEINLSAKQQMEVLENKARIEGKESGNVPGGAVGGGAPGMAPGAYPGGGMPGGVAGASKDISAMAMEYALNDEVLMKSRNGYIYADDSSLFPMFIRGRIYSFADLPADDVWLAQKSVWIQTDIINAIRETINDVFDARKLPESERNVLNSPIKHLVAINIEKAKSADTSKGGMMGPGGMPGGPGYGGGYQGGGYGSSTEIVKADTLTQYSSNELFDVSDYSFTVIMPTRYLPILEQKLLKQNYHVILNEEIVPADSSTPLSASAGGGMMGGGFGGMPGGTTSNIKGDLYNYGTEPVSRVTITAQLMLVSNFTRGQWDSKAKQWIKYPLMPVEVMKRLPQAALRQDDRSFLEQIGRLEKGEQVMEDSPTVPWYRNDAWRPETPAAADAKPVDKIQ